ncbi:MAG: GT4 family glycosyltransferase PelF [Actinobacteria bacterium]|nr:GT4 family glycosyltransferase PelF [Actinomycetota bacterium]
MNTATDLSPPVAPRPTAYRRGRPRVLLTTEGTYPHYTGGVSTWCDFLIREIGDVDFVVWSLMMNPFIKQQFAFPRNVVQYVGVPLWGVEQPAEYTREIPSGKVFESARRTKDRDVEREFVPLFNRFLDSVTAAVFDPDQFAGVLAEMHAYFRDWEYRTTWRSRAVWEAFKQKLVEPTQYSLPRMEEEEEGTLPTFSNIRENLGYLVRSPGRREERVEESEEVPTIGEAVEGLRWLYRLLSTLNVEVPQADVTHSAAAAFCAIPCILSKVERDTPFLLTEHGVYLREQYLAIHRRRYPHNLKRFLIDLISAVAQTSYHLADQVSPVCRFNTRWELAYGVADDRIRVIYNGVDQNAYYPAEVHRPGGMAPTVVSVSRIDPLKDQETMLRVADRVRRDMPNVRFIHYGPVADDKYWTQVQDLHRQLQLGDTVRFMGATSNVAEAMNGGDVVLLTSISEAFPYTVVEALMCGRPVVSTSVGGVVEALEGTGITARPRDVEGLAQSVITILRMPADERARMSRAARERGVERFTLAQFITEYRDSYYRLAESRVAAAPGIAPEAVAGPEVQEVRPVPEIPIELEGYAAPAPPAEAPMVLPETPVTREQLIAAAEAAAEAAGAPPAPPAGAELTLSQLVQALQDPDPFVRIGAIQQVRREPGVDDVLITALADEYPQVRREAVRALQRLGGTQAARALTEVAVHDPSAEVREEAVAALAALLGGEAMENGGAGA